MSLIFDGSFITGWQSRGGAISNFTFSCIVAEDRFSVMPIFSGREHVGKFTIKNGDVCNTSNGEERCQIAKMWPSSVIGTTQWYGFSFMLDPTWTSNGQWFMLWEYGWPSEVLDINNNNQLFIKQYYSNKATTLSAPIVKDQWYDVLIRIKLSYASDGIYEVFLRRPGEATYKQVHFSTGATAILNQLVHQLGPYRGRASTNTQIVYIADYKVGTTRTDVEYGGTSIPAPETQTEVPDCHFKVHQI